MAMLNPIQQGIQNGVTVYDPRGRFAQPPKPVRPRMPVKSGPGVSRLAGAASLSRAAKQQQEEEEDDNPFGRGLGFLINNPVTQTLLKPLEIMDYGRRAVTLGMEEFAEGITGQELKATEDDDRSNMEKLKDPTYGVGQLLGDLTGNKWIDRGIGLAGDIAFDPLSYVAGIGGAVTKGGVALNKTNRAGLAAKALDAGNDVASVERFVRRGVGAVDDDFLKSIGAERSAIRFNLPFAAGQGSKSVGVSGGGRAQRVLGAPGALGDVARRTRPGQRLAKIRTPKELETAYDRLFNAAGPASTRSAANRVAIENVTRVAQNTFKQVNDEAFKPLRAQLRKLKDREQALLIDSVETAAPFADEALESLRLQYSAFLDDLWTQADELGLEITRRQNYSPHILTRDAAKWLRNNGEQANKIGMVTTDLYDPSGITMRRQFYPGQELDINGTIVKFDKGTPVTVDQVNKKFRDAGLNFDFYESNAGVVLEKYLDMLSSDVGQAQGIMSRAGKGSVVDMSDEEMAMLGQGVLIRGGGKPQEGDVDEIRRLLGAERAPDQPEVFAAQPSVRVEPRRTKDGKTKLTKKGKAQLADGINPDDLDLETAVQWGKPVDRTKEYNQTMAERAVEQARQAGLRKQDAIDTVESTLTSTTRNVQGQLTRSYEEARSSANAARRRVVDLIEQTRSQSLRGGELETAIAQIDQAMAQIAEDIPVMDRALAAAKDRVRSQAIRQERDALVKEYDRLNTQIADLAKGMRSGRAAFLTAQAEDLEAAVSAPVKQAQETYEQVRGRAAEDAGLNRVIQAREQTLNDLAYAKARIADSPYAANEGTVASLQARLSRIDQEIAHLNRTVDADLSVAAAKRRLNQAEQQAITMPSAGAGVPNVKPRKVTGREAEILTGSQPMAPPPPRPGEVEELLTRQQQLSTQVAGLNRSIEYGHTVVNRSTAVANAERWLAGVTELKYKADIETAKARLNQVRREESKRLGLTEDLMEYERVQQQLNQVNRRLDQINNAKGATPDEVATARHAVRETMERNIDPGARVQAQRLRGQASEAAGAGSRLIPDLAARRTQVGDELAGIVNDPATRQAATGRGVERLTRPIVEAQREPRAAAQAATEFGGKLEGRRKLYVEELAQVNENLARSYQAVDEVLTNRQAADEVLAESQQLINRLNRTMLDGVDDAGQPNLAVIPELGEGVDAYERAAMWNIDSLNAIVDASDLPMDVKVSTQHYLNEAAKAQDEVRQLDLTQKRWEAMRDAGKKGELGRVVEVMLADGWSVPYPHLVGDNVAMADDLHRMFQEVRSAAFHKDFWPFIDTFTNLFKTYATLTPGFHVRNAISAAFINATEGVPMSTQLEGARLMTAYRRAADPRAWLSKQSKDVQGAFEAAFGSGIGGRYTERGIGQRGSVRYKTGERAFNNPLTRSGQWLGGMVEGSVRLPIALHSIRNGGDVTDALMQVTSKHFDYSQTSQFDEVAKRFIPFWTFMSRNLPLQLTQMWTKPRSYAKYNSFIRNVRGEDEPGTPDYFHDIGAFRLGESEMGGLPVYLQPDLAHTRLTEDIEKYSNIAQNPGRVLSDFNPLITAPIEFMTGKDIYTGRTYDETDVRTMGPLELPIQLLAQVTGNTRRTPEGQIAVEERFINAVRALLPAYDRSVRLAPGAMTGDASKDANSRQMESWLRFAGFPVRQLSPQQQQAALRSENFAWRDKVAMQRALAQLDAQG